MRATDWSDPTDTETAYRRAGGRRHYNSVRRGRTLLRLRRVVKELGEVGWRRGCQAEIARRLGVSRSTICRDMRRLDQLGNE